MGRGQDGGPLPLDRRPLAAVYHRRGEPPQPAVPVLRVVPVEKVLQPPACRRQAGEATREVEMILAGIKLGFREEILVGRACLSRLLMA